MLHAIKMAEQIQVQQLAMKNPKKVEVSRSLAAYNRRKKEELKTQKSEEQKSQVEPMLTLSYGIGDVLAVGVIGGLGYYVYQAKKGEVNAMPNNPS